MGDHVVIQTNHGISFPLVGLLRVAQSELVDKTTRDVRQEDAEASSVRAMHSDACQRNVRD